jgi:hypothetical protein
MRDPLELIVTNSYRVLPEPAETENNEYSQAEAVPHATGRGKTGLHQRVRT